VCTPLVKSELKAYCRKLIPVPAIGIAVIEFHLHCRGVGEIIPVLEQHYRIPV
jgi:hypothetical protein